MPRIALTDTQKYRVKYQQAREHTNAVMALNHITQREIAEISGKTQNQISKELAGKSKLSLEVFLSVQMIAERKQNEKKNIDTIASPNFGTSTCF